MRIKKPLPEKGPWLFQVLQQGLRSSLRAERGGLPGDLGASPVPVSPSEGLWDTGQGVLLKKSHSYLIPFSHPIKPHAIWLTPSYLRHVSHHLCPSVLEGVLSHGHPGAVSRQE